MSTDWIQLVVNEVVPNLTQVKKDQIINLLSERYEEYGQSGFIADLKSNLNITQAELLDLFFKKSTIVNLFVEYYKNKSLTSTGGGGGKVFSEVQDNTRALFLTVQQVRNYFDTNNKIFSFNGKIFYEKSTFKDGTVYLRDFYPELANLCISNALDKNLGDEVVITGTPGVGKSIFRNIVLYELLIRSDILDVVLLGHQGDIIHLEIIGDGIFLSKLDDIKLPKLKDGTFVLYDATAGKTDRINNVSRALPIIIFTSPAETILDSSRNSNEKCQLLMPLWEIEEIKDLCEKLEINFSDDKKEIIKKWGCIPRLIFNTKKESTRFEGALTSLIAHPNSKISHRIIHLVNNQYIKDEKVCYDFIYLHRVEKIGTPSMRSDWLAGVKAKEENWLQFLDSSKVPRDLFGRIFEENYIQELCKSKSTIVCKNLEDSKEKTITFPQLERKTFDSIDELEVNENNILWVPTSPTYPGIDAIVSHNSELHLLQMTIADKHPICKSFKKVMDVLKEKANKILPFVFVVLNEDSLRTFPKATIPTSWKLTQFAGIDRSYLSNQINKDLITKSNTSKQFIEGSRFDRDSEESEPDERTVKKRKTARS